MTSPDDGWRTLAGVATAWYDAASLTESACLAASLPDDGRLDLRPSGVLVRVGSAVSAAAVTSAAGAAGLRTDPSALQRLGWVVSSPSPDSVSGWWQRLLGVAPAEVSMSFEPSDPRPLRDRWHVDVVRPGPAAAAAAPGEGGGPYGLCHVDPGGLEVDLVPGDPPTDETSDWTAVFSTVACYRVDGEARAALAAAAARLADEARWPLLIGVRPGLVVLESGKDRGEGDFLPLAAALQVVARDLGAVADASAPLFVQAVLGAVDVDAVRAFWLAALGYVADPRDGVTDIHDPRRLDSVVVFQPLDPDDVARMRQPSRVRLELEVPAAVAASRIAAALGAGGRVVGERAGRTTIADPEGNQLVVVGRR